MNGMARKRRAFEDITHDNTLKTPHNIHVTKRLHKHPEVDESSSGLEFNEFILDEKSGEIIRNVSNSFNPCAISTPKIANNGINDENTFSSAHPCAFPTTPHLTQVVKQPRVIKTLETSVSECDDWILDEMSGCFRKSQPLLSMVSQNDTC
ncbi:40S ribosomal protein S22, partial [Frankliniella fusca]